ncbi:Cell death protease [Mycoemilia scoparia]|uniref:Pheromone-processing carboxypeptidase KEX1 n=1 Tax=Mycoemilia scoparia TaxID=417184 RepID=A0A9W8A834_9FUNG|nr:Cell death protease [Mycoemilia scoparia]
MVDKDSFKVDKIPKVVDPQLETVEQWAGQIPIAEGNDDDLMFFWLISNSTNHNNQDSLVIWLNGGPGCIDGVIMENGPYLFKDDELHLRPYAWSSQMDVLYIDQPFGTGMSVANKTSYVKTFVNGNDNLMKFMERFFNIFSEYRDRKLYIAGESEAGTYLIYFADAVLKMPAKNRYNLQGVLIGNGWIDGFTMYQSYPAMAEEAGVLTDEAKKAMYKEINKCVAEYNKAPQPVHVDACEQILNTFLMNYGPSPDLCYNMYNLDLNDTKPACGMNWPESVGNMTSYMRRPDVHKALNLHEGKVPERWVECNRDVSVSLLGDKSKPSVQMLPSVLESIPVLLFVGDRDIVCNHIGIEWMIGNLTWNGEKGFVTNEGQSWFVDDNQAGIYISERNLTYVRIYNSSHMVGVDHPKEMLDILTRFTGASTDTIRFKSELKQINFSKNTKSSDEVGENSGNNKFLLLLLLLALIIIGGLGWWYRKRLVSWIKSCRGSKKTAFPLGGSSERTLENDQEHELESIRPHRESNENPFKIYDPNDFVDDDGIDDDDSDLGNETLRRDNESPSHPLRH